jgi:uncharacterized protein involved in exopolysaccharide biosynthesis
LERRLQALRGRLANLRAEFREEYPDILIVKKEIAVLEAELKTVASTDVSPSPSRFPATNPLVGQLAEQLREINAIKRRQESTAEQIRVYEKRVENTPYREQQLTMLLRDYENVQRNYQGLLSKRQEAKISESLERRQKAEIFRILDPALLPQRPDKPNRPLLILLGLCGGLAAGLGLAFVREQMDPAIQTEGDLVAATTGLPLLAVIPLVKDGRVRTPRRDALSATGVGSKR